MYSKMFGEVEFESPFQNSIFHVSCADCDALCKRTTTCFIVHLIVKSCCCVTILTLLKYVKYNSILRTPCCSLCVRNQTLNTPSQPFETI
jgi:hypothetical protein